MRKAAWSKRELQRADVLARLKAGEVRLKDAAELLRRIGCRQGKRLWKRRRGRVEARPCGTEIQLRPARLTAAEDSEAGAGEMQRRQQDAVRA